MITLKKIGNIEIRLEVEPCCALDLSWDDDGSVRAGIEDGSYVAFDAKVSVLRKGIEIGADYLGECIYESLEAFRASDFVINGKQAPFPGAYSYCRDMMHEALGRARDWAN